MNSGRTSEDRVRDTATKGKTIRSSNNSRQHFWTACRFISSSDVDCVLILRPSGGIRAAVPCLALILITAHEDRSSSPAPSTIGPSPELSSSLRNNQESKACEQ